MVEITGNTYPVKDQIKALGGRWNAGRKCWMVPDAKADEALALVKPKASSKSKGPRLLDGETIDGQGNVMKDGKLVGHYSEPRAYRPRTCATCGCKINYGVYCGKCEYGR